MGSPGANGRARCEVATAQVVLVPAGQLVLCAGAHPG
jgi:hypothetical protein